MNTLTIRRKKNRPASSKKAHKSLAFLDLANVQEEALVAAARHAVHVLKKRVPA